MSEDSDEAEHGGVEAGEAGDQQQQRRQQELVAEEGEEVQLARRVHNITFY